MAKRPAHDVFEALKQHSQWRNFSIPYEIDGRFVYESFLMDTDTFMKFDEFTERVQACGYAVEDDNLLDLFDHIADDLDNLHDREHRAYSQVASMIRDLYEQQ